MVEPISDEERAAFYRKVKLGIAALVGLSAGLTTLQIDATTLQTGAAIAAGLVVGWALAWFVVPSEPISDRQRSEDDRLADRPFADGNGEDRRESERRR